MLWNKQTKQNLAILLIVATVLGVTVGAWATHKEGHNPGGGKGGDPTPPDPVIAYNNDGDIMVMNADGSNKTVVLSGAGNWVLGPDWSTDGTLISFNGILDLGGGIYITDLAGNVQEFFADIENWWDTHGPRWSPGPSPDGKEKLVFVNRPNLPDGTEREHTDLFLINADGTGLINLTNTPNQSETGPMWALDGHTIAAIRYETCCDADRLILYELAEVDGEIAIWNETDISALAEGLLPTDLKWLAWANTQDKVVLGKDSDLWIFDLKFPTDPLVRLTPEGFGGGEREPSWSPNDEKVVFWMSGARGKDREGIFVINVDGTGLSKLSSKGRNPDWWVGTD